MRYEQDRRIAERGHRIYVVTCRTFGAPAFEKSGGIEICRVPSIVIPVIEFPFPNLLLMYSWSVKLIKKNNVDLIHVEDGAYLTSLIVLPVRRWLRKPVLLSMQGFPGVSWFYGISIVDLMARVYALTLGKLVLKSVDKLVLSATQFVEDAVRLGVHQENVDVIPRGVDLQEYRPNPERRSSLRAKLGVKNGMTLLLFAGRLVPVKGLDFFIKAARNLIQENNNLQFIVAGDGVLRSKYQKETRDLGSKVKFVGYRHDMSDLMNASDVFVLSSISEGCPNAVIEAGACAKPAVATRVGAAPDIVVDGVTGFLVKSQSVASLCEGIRKILARPDLEEMGKRARDRMERFFSWKKVVDQWEKVYKDTLNQAENI